MISKQNEKKQFEICYVASRPASARTMAIRTVSLTPELASSPDQSINNNLNESININAVGVRRLQMHRLMKTLKVMMIMRIITIVRWTRNQNYYLFDFLSKGRKSKSKPKAKYCADIVITPFGFELMSHLALEFSSNNLLFNTEYVQLKNLLKEEFEDAINKLLHCDVTFETR